jgi:hypothetical protein
VSSMGGRSSLEVRLFLSRRCWKFGQVEVSDGERTMVEDVCMISVYTRTAVECGGGYNH